MRTAVAATVVIAIGAFVLSFAALTDLAQRSGIAPNLAWIWPIIIDGMIVASTVAIVALNGHNRRAMVYPWTLLFFGAIVSTAANSTHAILTVDSIADGVPPLVSALVAAMPPVVLLAITHLTVHMYQKKSEAAELRAAAEYDEEAIESEKYSLAYDDGFTQAMADAQVAEAERVEAARLKAAEDIARARVESKVEAQRAAAKNPAQPGAGSQQVSASAAVPNGNKKSGTGKVQMLTPAGKTTGASPLYDEVAQQVDNKN
ncbi:excisionase [Arthrobacter sp. MYb227]|nr:excisionase [Arthrobacter sp. MYb227]